jgi:hypothetical protein
MTHLSDLALDRLVDDGAPHDHLATCAYCTTRLTLRRKEQAAFLQRARPVAFAEGVLQRVRRRRRRLFWAAAPALAAACALLLLFPRAPDERTKGGPVVELYARSGGRVAPHAPGSVYHAGDALQLVYTTPKARHLLVLDVEEGGRCEVLFRSAGPLGPAHRQRLEQSWVLDGEVPSERLFVLFSPRPVDPSAACAAASAIDVRVGGPLRLDGAASQSFWLRRR